MWTAAKKLAYLKVLIALAWADGELCNRELNFIKHLALKFRLSDKAWQQLDPLLDDPVTPAEGEGFFRDFLGMVGSPGEKERLLADLRKLSGLDEHLSREEERFLDMAADMLKKANNFTMLVSPFKELCRSALSAVGADGGSRDDFRDNKILYKLKRRIEQGKLRPVDGERLRYLSLFAGLLARVAHVDLHLSDAEIGYIRKKLFAMGEFDAEEAGLIAEAVRDATVSGVDNAALVADFMRCSSREQQEGLLSCLFKLAAADGKVSNAETEEIRAIAYSMQFSHKTFIQAKLRAKE